MKITGHRTETSFMKYIKVTPRETANRLRELWRENTQGKVKPLRVAQ
jgi:hypothetical protein